MRSLGLLLAIIIIFNACSVKKRNYRPGYYVDWAFNSKHKSTNTNLKQKNTQTKSVQKNEEISFAATQPNTELAVTNNKLTIEIPKTNSNLLILNDTVCNDIINLRNGSILKAKVIEINETQIKYRRCDYLDGPLIVINKNDVYSIKYNNGNTDHFVKTPETQNSNTKSSGSSVVRNGNNANGKKMDHPLVMFTVLATALILFASIFALIAALILAQQAKKAILLEPDKYSGLKTVQVCQTICYVLLGIVIFLLALILFSLFI